MQMDGNMIEPFLETIVAFRDMTGPFREMYYLSISNKSAAVPSKLYQDVINKLIILLQECIDKLEHGAQQYILDKHQANLLKIMNELTEMHPQHTMIAQQMIKEPFPIHPLSIEPQCIDNVYRDVCAKQKNHCNTTMHHNKATAKIRCKYC